MTTREAFEIFRKYGYQVHGKVYPTWSDLSDPDKDTWHLTLSEVLGGTRGPSQAEAVLVVARQELSKLRKSVAWHQEELRKERIKPKFHEDPRYANAVAELRDTQTKLQGSYRAAENANAKIRQLQSELSATKKVLDDKTRALVIRRPTSQTGRYERVNFVRHPLTRDDVLRTLASDEPAIIAVDSEETKAAVEAIMSAEHGTSPEVPNAHMMRDNRPNAHDRGLSNPRSAKLSA